MRKQPDPSRRQFLKSSVGLGAVATGLSACQSTGNPQDRAKGATYMGDFSAEPLERIRVGFIGTGARGGGHVAQMLLMEGVEVVAICDAKPKNAARGAKRVTDAGRAAPAVYDQGEEDYLRMLESESLDAVIISTPWRWHAPMGVATMLSGAHAFVEVPMAVTLDEMWQLVDTSEATGKHCMMMENVCYGREELMFLNMVRKKAIGQITHGEAAYIHDLRGQIGDLDQSEGEWRVAHHVHRDGNLYPTHGLGPIAQMMGCERGTDRMERLVSFSSPAFGRALQAERTFSDPEHPRNTQEYICGDMNTSLIKTLRGRTIMVQHDTTSPRPYSRLNLISGTRGTLAGFPTRVALDPDGKGVHKWTQKEDLKEVYARWEHPLYRKMGEVAREAGGHGGMDFIMLWRIAYCLREGLPLDQNVYEGATWSAVSALSEASVASGGEPQRFPDFTRGEWTKTRHLQVVS